MNLKRTAAPGKQTFQVKASGSVRMLGMKPDLHPAALGENEFVDLQNIRRVGPDIVGRPGQILLVDLALEPVEGDNRNIIGGDDLPVGTVRRMMCVGDGCPGEDVIGQSLSSFTLEQFPNFQRPIYKPTATRIRPAVFSRAASVDGLIPPTDGRFFSVDNKLYQYTAIPVGYDDDPLLGSGGNQEVLVWTAPATYSHITAMIQHGGVMLIAVQGAAAAGIGTSAIIRWDGLTFSVDVTGINPVTGFATFRDLCVAGFSGAPNEIRVRTSAGVWSAVAPSAGTVGILGDNRCDSYQDQLYLPYGEDIFVFNGTTLTRIPVATTGVNAGASIYGVVAAFGYLYALWSSATPRCRLLRFDNTTWIANHKDFIAQDATVREARSIRLFQGCLLLSVTTTAEAIILRSPRRNASGTYTSVDPSGGTGIGGDITEMVEF